MNEMLSLAEKMLDEYGEFYPYGAYMKQNGEIVHIGAKNPQTDRPKSKDLIAILKDSFRDLAKAKRCKATAIVYDVVVPLPNQNCSSDSIQVCLDHMDNYSAEVFFPYRLLNNEVVLAHAFAQEGRYEIFGRKEG
jgi:hypothetical protein